MLKMQFKPKDSASKSLNTAKAVYEQIWEEESKNIIRIFRELTGLNFKQTKITVLVVPGDESSSGMPGVAMELAADVDDVVKRAMITHELSHRLLGGNEITIEGNAPADAYFEHRRIDLFLYDAWCDLYGQKFAGSAVKRESQDMEYYGKAWRWALNKNRNERQNTLRRIIHRKT